MIKKYFNNIGYSINIYFDNITWFNFDKIVNALFFGDPNETISARMDDCNFFICKFMCFILNLFDKNHCEKQRKADERSLWRWDNNE